MPVRSTTMVRIEVLDMRVTTLVRGMCARRRRWSIGVAPTWSKVLVLSLTTLVLRCVPSMCLGSGAWKTRELGSDSNCLVGAWQEMARRP